MATAGLGLDLMRAQGPGNLVLSPDSVAAALAMTGTGARGITAAQIAQTLHLKGPTAFPALGDLQRTIAEGVGAAQGGPDAPTLRIANGLFLQRGFPFERAFLLGAERHFDATPQAVDFVGDPTGALETINNWVKERTFGLIPRILNWLPEEMRLALANAVYLKAAWEYPFKPRWTRGGTFHGAAGGTFSYFMSQLAPLRYGAGPGFRAVELPYRSSTLSLLLLLPSGSRSLGPLQHRLDGPALSRIARGLSPRRVLLSMPRFTLNTEVDLSRSLKRLGMANAFSSAADFSGITKAGRLEMAFVRHAADFTVSEKGTLAAAATVIGLAEQAEESLPANGAVIFDADRPFLFFLRDERTGAVLFAGRLVSPESEGQ